MIQISNIKIRKDISDTKLFETIIKKYKLNQKMLSNGIFQENLLMLEKKTTSIIFIQLI